MHRAFQYKYVFDIRISNRSIRYPIQLHSTQKDRHHGVNAPLFEVQSRVAIYRTFRYDISICRTVRYDIQHIFRYPKSRHHGLNAPLFEAPDDISMYRTIRYDTQHKLRYCTQKKGSPRFKRPAFRGTVALGFVLLPLGSDRVLSPRMALRRGLGNVKLGGIRTMANMPQYFLPEASGVRT